MSQFRAVREDTQVGTIEDRYSIELHSRSNAEIGNLLRERGFDSVTQLIQAYRRRLFYHPRKRRIFLSFHAEDLQQVRGFRLMAASPNIEIEFEDTNFEPVNSRQSVYIKQQILEKIRRSEVVVCLIGNGTAWREMVDWELNKATTLGKGICGIRLKGARGRTPPLLIKEEAPIATWGLTRELIAAIESAAARRA